MTTSSDRVGPGHLVERPILCAELDKALERRLTVLVAQAGAGKSTLLRQWVATRPEQAIAFLDIGAADDDPRHFVQRLLESLATVEPAVAQVSHLITMPKAGLGRTVIGALVAALARMPELVLLLDNAQRLSNADLVADVGELLGQLPKNVHVVLSSRADPPIALSRYRLNDDVLELRQAELAFSTQEAAELLEQTTGRRLSDVNVRALHERTEGWAAGLQLAGLNLRHEKDPDAFVAAFGGSDRLVADYLLEEVLEVLPVGQRELLLRMSALDDMCAGLVHAVTGCENAQSVLEQMQRESMFLVELDSRREWFRFHHLFRDLLRSRLHAENCAAERSILSVAADWHLARGRAKSAVDYLLRARLWDRALETIRSNALDVLVHDDMATVVRWLLRIPASTRGDYVDAELFAGAFQLASGSSGGLAMGPAGTASDQLAAATHPTTDLGYLAAHLLLNTRPELAAAVAWRQLGAFTTASGSSTLDSGSESAPAGMLPALVGGGRAFFLAGKLDQAREMLVQSLSGAAASSPERVSALCTLSLLEVWCGHLERSETLIGEALLSAGEAGMLAHPSVMDAYLAAVMTALRRGDSGMVARKRPMIVPASEEPEDRESLSTMLFERAVSSLTQGDPERARGIVGSWAELVPEPQPRAVVQFHILLSWVAASDNDPDEAMRQLIEAVKMAEIHGIVGVFVRAGPIILRRLGDIAGPQAAFRDIILARAQQSIDPQRQQALPDPLTDRELEILSYLPTRFTNVELADRCFVSVNTIKTHMVHIYRKLDATNRDAAIGRARVLGLL